MKKRILCILIAAFMVVTPVLAEDEITVTVDGTKVEFDQTPVILNGRTLVPVRAVTEALGATVDWNDAERKATISHGENELVLTIDENIALVNGSDFKLDQAPMILSGRTMVPLRFISEKFGSKVEWNGDTRSITITKGAAESSDTQYADISEEDRYAYFEKFGSEIVEAVKFMDSKISNDIVDFYASLYDYETGCFYSSTSGKESYGFHPNIECTSQIFHAIQDGGGVVIYDELTEEQKERMYQYVASMQDPDDGYFYHPDRPKGKAALNRMNRDLSWATKYILERYTRREAPYPTASERIAAEAAEKGESASSSESSASSESTATSTPEYLQSKEAFLKYLEELWPTKTPYGHGDTMGALGTQARAAGMYDVLCDFIISKQDPETGLWGTTPGEITYSSTSGAMKLAGFFSGANQEYKNWQAAMRGCIDVLLDDSYAQYIVYIWNPISCIDQIKSNLIKIHGEVPQEYWDILLPQIPAIIYNSFKKFEAFAKPDGGYSYSPENGSEGIIGMNIGLGLYESDIDGTGKVRGFRTDIYDVLMAPHTPVFDSACIDRFFTQLREAKPTVKNTNITYENDFENYPILDNKKPADLTEKAYNTTGTVRIVKNPLDFRNKSLCVSGSKGARTSTRLGGFSLASENGEVQTIEFDMMVESGKYQIYHVTLGSTVYKLYVTGTGGDKFNLNYVTASSGSGKRITQLPCGEWIHFKLEYVPRGVEDTTVTLYANDEIILDNGEYYNAGNAAALPHGSIARFAVSGSNDSTGNMYFDNIKAYVVAPEEE